MPIRQILIRALPVVAAACVEPAPPPLAMPEAAPAAATPAPDTSRRGDPFCDHRRFTCDPLSPTAQQICDDACLFPSHCQDHSPGEYAFCAAHPDYFDRLGRYCNARGNPDWDTVCVAGPRP